MNARLLLSAVAVAAFASNAFAADNTYRAGIGQADSPAYVVNPAPAERLVGPLMPRGQGDVTIVVAPSPKAPGPVGRVVLLGQADAGNAGISAAVLGVTSEAGNVVSRVNAGSSHAANVVRAQSPRG
jgi:hypothetical protein